MGPSAYLCVSCTSKLIWWKVKKRRKRGEIYLFYQFYNYTHWWALMAPFDSGATYGLALYQKNWYVEHCLLSNPRKLLQEVHWFFLPYTFMPWIKWIWRKDEINFGNVQSTNLPYNWWDYWALSIVMNSIHKNGCVMSWIL